MEGFFGAPPNFFKEVVMDKLKKLKNKKAIGFVDFGVKILIAVVIGALTLGGFYALAKDNVLPTAKSKIESLFDYSQTNELEIQAPIKGDFNNDGIIDNADKDKQSWRKANLLALLKQN